MKILQILGSGRNCGKTTLGCSLLAAFPTLRWIAIKVTPHSHTPARQHPAADGHPQHARDTDRYRTAGAIESHLWSAPPDPARFASFADRADCLLLETGHAFAQLPWPLLRLAIAPADPALWKPGFAERRLQVDAQVFTGGDSGFFLRTGPHPPTPPVFPVAHASVPDPSLHAFVAAFLAPAYRAHDPGSTGTP